MAAQCEPLPADSDSSIKSEIIRMWGSCWWTCLNRATSAVFRYQVVDSLLWRSIFAEQDRRDEDLASLSMRWKVMIFYLAVLWFDFPYQNHLSDLKFWALTFNPVILTLLHVILMFYPTNLFYFLIILTIYVTVLTSCLKIHRRPFC